MQTLRNYSRLLLAGAVLALAPQIASAKNLALAQTFQRTTDANGNAIGNNWCWAACSKMILDFYGYPTTQEAIVPYGVGDITYDTWNYLGSSGSEERTGVAVWELKVPPATPPYELKLKTINPLSWKGIDLIIKNFSADEVSTQFFQRDLTAEEIVKEIDERDAPFVRRIGWDSGGGHFTVVYGVNAGVVSIRDPWYGSYVGSDALIRRGAISGGSFTWTHTLTTSKIIDVLFLFDTTGSMGSYISSAKANASALLDKIATKFKNYRVAVADYRDFPDDEPSHLGGPDDYVYRGRQTFTSDKATAQGGINAVPGASGGDDIPESVYSALYNGLRGNEIGAWREDPAKRVIILIGDAEGHNPEPFRGGHNFSEIVRIATNPDFPISVHCLWAGTSIRAGNQFSSIAGGTGGSVVASPTGTGTAAGLNAIVDSIAANPRFPKGQVASIYPTFTFESAGLGQGGMASNATKLYLEIQKLDPATSTYGPLRLVKLKKVSSTVYQATKPYTLGDYRWRLGFKRPAGKLFLPSLDGEEPPTEPVTLDERSSSGRKITMKTEGKTTFESTFTDFTRILSVPAKPTKLFPSFAAFTASTRSINFSFTSVPGATKYVLEVLRTVEGVETVFKKATIKAPKNDPGSVTLSKRLSGFDEGSFYTWRVQGLNYDRPIVDATAW